MNRIGGKEGVGESGGEVGAAALNPESLFGEGGMICNKLGVWNAVGIGQDEIIAEGGGEGSI